MSDLLVFTAGNNTALLEESCKSVNITLHKFEATFEGYVTTKVRKSLEFLQSLNWALRSEYIVMWVDGNDSLILKPERDIMARLHSMDFPLLISAESTCWPDAKLADRYPRSPIGYPGFLNAGGFVGRVNDVISALHIILRHAESEDDQREWTRCFLKKMLPLQIDYTRYIFASIGDGEDAIKSDSCVKHWNGRSPGREEYWDRFSRAGVISKSGIGSTPIRETVDERGHSAEVESRHNDASGGVLEVPAVPTGGGETASKDDLSTPRTGTLRVRRSRRTPKTLP